MRRVAIGDRAAGPQTPIAPRRGRLARWGSFSLGVLLAGAVAAPTASYADDETTTAEPLRIRLTGLTPAVIPAKGPITFTGRVTNTSSDPWRQINVAAIVSSSPMTTRAELAEAREVDTRATSVGGRLSDPGGFVGIGDLAPGQTTSFKLRVPRRLLPISGGPGAYWLGVQALGTGVDGRDSVADGRAMTFAPVAPKAATDARLVVPLRQAVHRTTDGRLLGADALAASMAPTGRLGRIVRLLREDDSIPVTVLLDPALLDAAQDIVDGNPPVSLGTTEAEPSPSASPTASETAGGPTVPTLDATDRSVVKTWLADVELVGRSNPLLVLPYGDVDAAALGREAPQVLVRAMTSATEALARHHLTGTPAIAPPNGWMDARALAQLPDDLVVLVGDHGAEKSSRHFRSSIGQSVLVTDSRAVEGGPGPGPATAALALRQRVLSDAALAAGSRTPLLVNLPSNWNPGPSVDAFVPGLGQNWLRWAPLDTAASGPVLGRLPYPGRQLRAEVPVINVSAAVSLLHTAEDLAGLLSTTNTVAEVLPSIAYDAVSYSARARAPRALVSAQASQAWAGDRLSRIQVSGTDFVTLSGGTGSVPVSVANGLDQAVRVGLVASSDDSRVTVTTPETVTLGAHSRTTIRVGVSTDKVGVHQITVHPVTADGQKFGEGLVFSMRSSQIGRWLSVAMKGAGALIFVLVAVRVGRRLRERKQA